MDPIPSALYLDFDNVFTELRKHDPEAGRRFAEQPGDWLARLTTTPEGRTRRWLVLRCYLNPAGAAVSADGATPAFAIYRQAFVAAGFEVVDCPGLHRKKNAADIRMTVDIMDSLLAPVSPREYVLGSADCDFTPLLVRLRAAGRPTTLVTSRSIVPALAAVADRVLSSQALVNDPPEVASGSGAPATASEQHPVRHTEGLKRLAKLVERRLRAAGGPVGLPVLGTELRRELAGHPGLDDWFGQKTLTRAIMAAGVRHARVVENRLWDESRQQAPTGTAKVVPLHPAG